MWSLKLLNSFTDEQLRKNKVIAISLQTKTKKGHLKQQNVILYINVGKTLFGKWPLERRVKTKWLASPVDKGQLPLISGNGLEGLEGSQRWGKEEEETRENEELRCLLLETVHRFWFHLYNVSDPREDSSKQSPFLLFVS